MCCQEGFCKCVGYTVLVTFIFLIVANVIVFLSNHWLVDVIILIIVVAIGLVYYYKKTSSNYKLPTTYEKRNWCFDMIYFVCCVRESIIIPNTQVNKKKLIYDNECTISCQNCAKILMTGTIHSGKAYSFNYYTLDERKPVKGSSTATKVITFVKTDTMIDSKITDKFVYSFCKNCKTCIMVLKNETNKFYIFKRAIKCKSMQDVESV